MKYTKPLIVSTLPATSAIQFGIDKEGSSADATQPTSNSYRSDE